MHPRWFVFIPFVLLATAAISSSGQHEIPNELIDAPGFQSDVRAAHQLRETRRLTEAEFLELASAPETVILDARSRHRFEQMHLAGAVHLNFADFTEDSLAGVIPSRDSTVLIYCNNNIDGDGAARDAFATKAFRAALNLSTYASLYTYGYQNVYELGPVIDPDSSLLRFEGTLVK